MAKSKKYVICIEIYNYPYCAKLDDDEDYLSDKVCQSMIKIRKKIVTKTKRGFVSIRLIFSLGGAMGQTVAPLQGVGLSLPNIPAIIRSSGSNVRSSKKVVIAKARKEMCGKIDFTNCIIS